MRDRTLQIFPADFVWGAATAAAQIEGAVDEDGKSESVWDHFAAWPGTILGGDTLAVACDHYHRFEEDVRLLRGAWRAPLPLLGGLAARVPAG